MIRIILICSLILTFNSHSQSKRFSPGQKIKSFHIGNSLTWDSQPKAITKIALEYGYQATTGYHIACEKPLTYIAQNPKDVCVKIAAGFGYWENALINTKLDFVTLQPSLGSTLKSEADAIINFIELCRSAEHNSKTIFYINACWPAQKDFNQTWTKDYADTDDNPTILCAKYFKHLIARVRKRTDASVYLIPAGEVLYNLGIELTKGKVKDLPNIQALFRDKTLLTLDRGRFAVALATYCTIYKQDPVDILKPNRSYGNKKNYSPEYYQAVYKAINKATADNSDKTK